MQEQSEVVQKISDNSESKPIKYLENDAYWPGQCRQKDAHFQVILTLKKQNNTNALIKPFIGPADLMA